MRKDVEELFFQASTSPPRLQMPAHTRGRDDRWTARIKTKASCCHPHHFARRTSFPVVLSSPPRHTHSPMSATTLGSALVPRVAARAGVRAKTPVAVASRPMVAKFQKLSSARFASRASRRGQHLTLRASDENASETTAPMVTPHAAGAALAPPPAGFARICAFEDLPRGDRKKVDALGKAILLFWYKDTVCCIEGRSPAEGAFSEGFGKARLTQDGCITCPGTQSTFDLKTGEIKSWFPDNPFLRRLTPIETCRPMEVFPVLVRGDGIFVDVKNGSLGPDFRAATTSGGSDTSLENNNVYAVEPKMYVQGLNGEQVLVQDGIDSKPQSEKMDPGAVAISIAGVAALALGGSATLVFYENYVALGLFWLVGFGLAAQKSLEITGALDDDDA